MASFLAGQVPTAAELGRATLAGEVVGRARRDTNSPTSTSTTPVAVLRLPGTPVYAGRLYEIKTGGLATDGATNNDTLVVEIRYTTDGSTPTTASTVLPGATSEDIQPNAASPVTEHISTTYTPPADQTLSLLLCIKHGIGTGVMGLLANGASNIIEMLVIDRGVDTGDVGVDL